VEIKQKTEGQMRIDIFNVYCRHRNESSSDRRQVYFGQLCELIFRWHSEYYEKGAKKIGYEIFMVVRRLVNYDLPDENAFFRYLFTSLKNAKIEFLRKETAGDDNLPRITKVMKSELEKKESDAGRSLTHDERVQFISTLFNKTEEDAKEYLDGIEMDLVPLYTKNDEGYETDILGSVIVENNALNPEDEYFSMLEKSEYKYITQRAVETVLEKKSEKARNCCRALFTLFCINESIDYDGLELILDKEIIEAYKKDQKKPFQYEVYLKYNPNVTKESADASAARMLKGFFRNLASLKEKRS